MYQKNKLFNLIGILLLLVSTIYTSFVIYQNKQLYLTKFDLSKFKRAFEQSQWRVPNSTRPISDETLYTYAGYLYIQGENPILINPEAPPLGKYLIGLSIQLFDNAKILNVIFGYTCLMLIFFMIYYLTRSLLSSSLAVFLTSINTLFIDQLIHNPQLEIIQLFFLLVFTCFFILYEKKGDIVYVLLSGLTLGFFLSVKAFTYHVLLVFFTLSLYILKDALLIRKKIEIKRYFFIFILFFVSCVTYMITYFGYFLHSGTLRGFFGVQKWIFLFYKSSGIDMFRTIGSYLSLIFINRWRFWTKNYPLIPYQDWSVLWPFVFLLACFASLKLLKNNTYTILISFFVIYNIFLLFTPLYPRYLLLLFTIGNIIITLYFDEVINVKHEKKKK
ncbi:glycosyltransferase family 39 protein [Candidatus Roizmanbacteria bacterium]|nr:glycosyltransferase family 39 protein [Candidatus Roizmanbacteria bacterium]